MLDRADRAEAGAFCLSSIVAELRKGLLSDPAASALFDDRLISVGYFDRDEYGARFFRLGSFRHFAIREGFPRIVQSRLPAGIGSVKYELKLQECLPYEVVDIMEEL